MPTYLEIGLLALYAVVVWWGATGLILYLNRRPESTYQSSLWGAAAVAAAGLIGAVLLRETTDVAGAILGFTCALAIWAFNEMLFLMGVVVGTHREPSPPHERGWPRFKRASLAIAYHELSLASSLVVLAAISIGRSERDSVLDIRVAVGHAPIDQAQYLLGCSQHGRGVAAAAHRLSPVVLPHGAGERTVSDVDRYCRPAACSSFSRTFSHRTPRPSRWRRARCFSPSLCSA